MRFIATLFPPTPGAVAAFVQGVFGAATDFAKLTTEFVFQILKLTAGG